MNRSPAAAALQEGTTQLHPVGLPEVMEYAALQTRVDRKYLLPPTPFLSLVDGLRESCHVLQIDGTRTFGYESVYFDTSDLASYRRAATERRRKFKVRTRSYLDSGDTMLEVKTEGGRGETVKDRMAHPGAERDTLGARAQAFVDERIDVPARSLAAVLTTTYARATMVDPRAGFRMTCDADLELFAPSGQSCVMGDHVLVETKSVGNGCPADHLLWRMGHRPVRLSKYCVGMAALHPRLPANRWNLALRRYFGWRPAPMTARAT